MTSPNNPLKVGLVGLDTSHVVAFTELLNDPKNEHPVPGACVVAGFPGGSPDFDLSRNRVEGFTAKLRDEWSVKIMDSPQAVAEAVDLLFITSVDGRVHLDQLERTVKFKRPTFIDKPLAVKSADARAIVSLARDHGVPLMSCSSVRYGDMLSAVLAESGEVAGCDAWGPMAEVPTQPGLFWYGVHTVDTVVRVMGAGCREVRCFRNATNDLATLVWGDGRVASVRGMRAGHSAFGCVVHKKDGARVADIYASKRPPYASMLEAIIKTLPHGKSDVPAEQMVETVRIIEAANESRDNGGVAVTI